MQTTMRMSLRSLKTRAMRMKTMSSQMTRTTWRMGTVIPRKVDLTTIQERKADYAFFRSVFR